MSCTPRASERVVCNTLHGRHFPPKADLRTGRWPPNLPWKGPVTTMELVVQGEDKGQRQKPLVLLQERRSRQHRAENPAVCFPMIRSGSPGKACPGLESVRRPRKSCPLPLGAFVVKGPPPSLPFDSTGDLHSSPCKFRQHKQQKSTWYFCFT